MLIELKQGNYAALRVGIVEDTLSDADDWRPAQ